MRQGGNCGIINARLVLPDSVTAPTTLRVVDGCIATIGEMLDETALDAHGGYVFPGFIDVHVHGGGGADFMDGTPQAFETVVKTHLAHGTTTMLPTALTATREELEGFIRAYHAFQLTSPYAALTAGLHLEGPYFSTANGQSTGAQAGSLIRAIDFDEVQALLDLAAGSILRWDAAPESAESARFAQMLTEAGVICAVAHSDATAEEATCGFEAGFSHVTHFYNAVTAYKKRGQLVTAGVVEAAYLDDRVTVELIADGHHVPSACARLALKLKGTGVLAITDGMRLAGTDQTAGKLGSLSAGTDVIVEDGVAKLSDRSSFAGSITTMDRALIVLCREWGLDPVTAAGMLSAAPAKHLGLENRKGQIKEGYAADLVITDETFSLTHVIQNGHLLK